MPAVLQFVARVSGWHVRGANAAVAACTGLPEATDGSASSVNNSAASHTSDVRGICVINVGREALLLLRDRLPQLAARAAPAQLHGVVAKEYIELTSIDALLGRSGVRVVLGFLAELEEGCVRLLQNSSRDGHMTVETLGQAVADAIGIIGVRFNPPLAPGPARA